MRQQQQQQQQQEQQQQQVLENDEAAQQLMLRGESPPAFVGDGGVVSPSSAWVADCAAHAAHSADILLPAHLARSAREQLYMGFFGSTMLAANTTNPSDAAMNFASMGWTRHIGPLYETDPAVRCAALATSSAIIATLHGDKQLQVKGIQAYNGAVLEMAKGLQRTNWYKRDGLLAAARIMATFEVSRKGLEGIFRMLTMFSCSLFPKMAQSH